MLPKLIASKQPKYVLFSLCGKTIEMKAVLDNGHRVIGIEGSQTAIEAFFNENQISYEIEKDETNQYEFYKVDFGHVFKMNEQIDHHCIGN